MTNTEAAKKTTRNEEVTKNVLTNAVEGGSGYWAALNSSKRDDELMYIEINVSDKEDGDDDKHQIGQKEVIEAIKKIASGEVKINSDMKAVIARLINTKEDLDEVLTELDADHSDAIVQVAAYGEIVFG